MMTDFIQKAADRLKSYGPCGCLGKRGGDPYCPCEMRARGLQPTVLETPAPPDLQKLREEFDEAARRG